MGTTPTIVFDVYDWQFDSSTSVLPCDIKSDKYHKYIPDAGGAKFTAKRRVETNAVFSALLLDESTNYTQQLFRLDLIDASNSYTQITGQGFVTSGTLAAPRGAADDTIEITFDGVWQLTTP